MKWKIKSVAGRVSWHTGVPLRAEKYSGWHRGTLHATVEADIPMLLKRHHAAIWEVNSSSVFHSNKLHTRFHP